MLCECNLFLSEISSSHICSLETFHLRCVSDVGVTRLLRTCQTRFQCFQTPCAKLRLHHTSQDRYVQLPQLSWPSCCQATAAVGQLASPNTAIFQRTSNPEVKAKAATHKTMKSVIMIQLLVIRKPKVLDTEALTVERLSGGARQTQGSFPLSARLYSAGCLACQPAARRVGRRMIS